MLKLTIYLAGYSGDTEYREFVEKNWGENLNLINPMNITHLEVIEDIGKNEYSTCIVRRDKKLILSSDILVAFLSEHSPSFGTTMEIIYAYENGIPVYVIDGTKGMSKYNDAWVKFHTKKSFDTITECFNFITSTKF